jgi:hypothetical protein
VSCRRIVEGEARRPVPIWPQVDGPFLRRKRMIWLRVRFIRMFDMERPQPKKYAGPVAVDGSTAAGYSRRDHVGRGSPGK